jgi:RNA recognition motif-containing protein
VKTLYLGSLPFSATQNQMWERFARHGRVRAVRLMINRVMEPLRDFGFVTMEEDAASAATASCNGKSTDGPTLEVNGARRRG